MRQRGQPGRAEDRRHRTPRRAETPRMDERLLFVCTPASLPPYPAPAVPLVEPVWATMATVTMMTKDGDGA